MGSPKPPIQNVQGLLAALVNWLTGIETWSRAGIALMLGAGILLGSIIYRNPERIFDLFSAALQPAPPQGFPFMTPLTTDVQREIDQLLEEFKPNMIGITAWRIDLRTNQQELVAAAVLPEYKTLMDALVKARWRWPVAAFRDDPKVNDILGNLYTGRFVCTEPEETWIALDRFPLVEMCLVPIPPSGVGLAGFIGGGWRRPIDVDERDAIEVAFRASAERLVWHR
jgi:hypothetical protein